MQKFFLKTFGCQMNFSDSERIQKFLEDFGLTETQDKNRADLVILNTCGVRQTAEDRVFGAIHNLRKKNQKAFAVITGCLADRKDVQKKLQGKVDLFLPIKDILKLDLKSNPPRAGWTSQRALNYLGLTPKYQKPESILVPIMTGCNNFCSYCVVPFARGREVSRPTEKIVAEIAAAAKDKKLKKITLLGQNVNSYRQTLTSPGPSSKRRGAKENSLELLPLPRGGREGSTITFPTLLNFLAKKFPQVEFSFLTSHPKDFSDDLISVIQKNPNISRQIHLPIQSGSDQVLRAMNRKYTSEHYLGIIKKIKKNLPGVQISTDVIVGFPAETEDEFRKTVEVFQLVKFSEAFVNKYSPRPGTAAQALGDPVPWNEKKRREKILRSLIAR